MPTPRSPIRLLLLLLAAATLHAQTASQPTPSAPTPAHKPRPPKPDQPSFNSSLIFLDPAHGGDDPGAKLPEDALEKDITLAFAIHLKALLSAHGFTIISTRDTSDTTPTPDQRVEQANRSRALACLIVHASPAGHGVRLYTSSLASPATSFDDSTKPIVPWDTAQAPSLPRSAKLSADLASAINAIRVPLVAGRASIRPIDSLTCPAIAIELSPLSAASGESPSPADAAYQDRIAQALTNGLVQFRTHALAQIVTPPPTTPAPTTPATKPKPASRPKAIPEEVPDIISPEKKPAPIIRRPPPARPPVAPSTGAPQ